MSSDTQRPSIGVIPKHMPCWNVAGGEREGNKERINLWRE